MITYKEIKEIIENSYSKYISVGERRHLVLLIEQMKEELINRLDFLLWIKDDIVQYNKIDIEKIDVDNEIRETEETLKLLEK